MVCVASLSRGSETYFIHVYITHIFSWGQKSSALAEKGFVPVILHQHCFSSHRRELKEWIKGNAEPASRGPLGGQEDFQCSSRIG